MSRERLTGQAIKAADALEAQVAALEQSVVAVDDAQLPADAAAAAKEEKTVVSESVPAGKPELKDNGDQNAKANKNWPVSEADKQKVAAKLILLAKELLEG